VQTGGAGLLRWISSRDLVPPACFWLERCRPHHDLLSFPPSLYIVKDSILEDSILRNSNLGYSTFGGSTPTSRFLGARIFRTRFLEARFFETRFFKTWFLTIHTKSANTTTNPQIPAHKLRSSAIVLHLENMGLFYKRDLS